MHRREFFSQALTIVSVVAAGSLASACSGSPTSASSGGQGNAPLLPVLSGTVNGTSVTLTIAAGSALANPGSGALVNSSRGSFLVFRVDQSTFNAMTAICTHEQCTITEFTSPTFVCDCHGSRYNSTGGVVQGPATRALTRFNTSFDGTVLTIST